MKTWDYIQNISVGDVISGVHAGDVSSYTPPVSTGLVVAIDRQLGFFEVMIEGCKIVEIWYEDVATPK